MIYREKCSTNPAQVLLKSSHKESLLLILSLLDLLRWLWWNSTFLNLIPACFGEINYLVVRHFCNFFRSLLYLCLKLMCFLDSTLDFLGLFFHYFKFFLKSRLLTYSSYFFFQSSLLYSSLSDILINVTFILAML